MEISTQSMLIIKHDQNVIEIKPHEHWASKEGVEHAKENVEAIKKLTGGNSYSILAYIPEYALSKEAEEIYAQYAHKVICTAIIANNFIQKVVGNLAISASKGKSPFPIKIFQKRDMAVSWILKQQDYSTQIK